MAQRARTLIVFGTTSDAGKSTLVAALCRAFSSRGVDVAPFKAQNMARNAYVCDDGGEIGVAQAVQAIAAGKTPCVDHNPILLKPEPGMVSQLIVHGKARGSRHFADLRQDRALLHEAVQSSLERLRARHALLLIEGAGSPAEVNLQDRDLANLACARMADADILLVGDIDRGGVFAALVGTLELLPADLRPRVRGLIINKLRGDPGLLASGIEFLEKRTGVPVLGVVPHLGDIALPAEDSLALERHRGSPRAPLDALEIAVVDAPCLANFEDVLPLAHEPGVELRLTRVARELLEADLVVLLGSKSTVHDLGFLREHGLDRALPGRAARGAPILAICGGAQMLGQRIDDPHHIESEHASMAALGLLPIVTHYGRDKSTRRVSGTLLPGELAGARVEGFELHFGRLERTGDFETSGAGPALRLDDGRAEGCVKGSIIATMVHRVLDRSEARDAVLLHLRARRGLAAPPKAPPRASPYDELAARVTEALDFQRLAAIALGSESR
jgi:adenosylcobyric acid synthase